jgi:hypothetical protein
MRPALLIAAALAGAALAPAPTLAWADDPKSDTDIRCVVVGGALTQSTDPQLASLGRASLFYFLGRLEGRGAADNLDARVVEAVGKMSADDVKTQWQVCGPMFMAATQSLQALGNAAQQHFGPPPATPAPATPAPPPR